MSTFKNIEKLGLKIIDLKGIPYCVDALALEDILKSAQVVYGQIETEGFANYWSDSMLAQEKGKRTARLVMIEELLKKPIKKEYFQDTDDDYIRIPNEFKCRQIKITVEEVE